MLGFWRWAGLTVILVGALAAFMVLDKTTLHWYVPESDGSAARNNDPTPSPSAIVTLTPTVTPQFTAFEARALAFQWVSGNFGSPGGWDCDQPELNDLQSRWTAACTERPFEGIAGQSGVKTVAVDAITGTATELQTAATAATKTPTSTATPTPTASATATTTPQ